MASESGWENTKVEVTNGFLQLMISQVGQRAMENDELKKEIARLSVRAATDEGTIMHLRTLAQLAVKEREEIRLENLDLQIELKRYLDPS